MTVLYSECMLTCVCVGYLLNDAILNVDVCFLGEVIIHHLPSLDEDTHVGSHCPTRRKRRYLKL